MRDWENVGRTPSSARAPLVALSRSLARRGTGHGGYCAECLTENIFTKGDTWDELRKNVVEATSAFFFDRLRPERVRLHLVRDEILSVA